ncbi:MAG: TRAM domain-containing protein, partial [Nitrososphaerota archaeon]
CVNVSRYNKKNKWNPYTSNIQRFSIYPPIKTQERPIIKVGDTLTVEVYDINEKGQGVVYYKDKKIIIPNATSGSRVKVKVFKVQEDVVIAHVVDVVSESNTGY